MTWNKLLRTISLVLVLRVWRHEISFVLLRFFGWQRLKVSDLSTSSFNFEQIEKNSDGVGVNYAIFGSKSRLESQHVYFPLRKWNLGPSRIVLNTKFPSVQSGNRLWITPRLEMGPYFFSASESFQRGSQIRAQANDLVLQVRPSIVRRVSEALYCGTRAPNNWGHWLMNFLPGVMLAAEYFQTSACPPLIVPKSYRAGESRQALFELFWGDRPVLELDSQTSLEIKRLHWFEQPVSDSPRPVNRDFLLPKSVNVATLSRFRRRILDFAAVNLSFAEPTRNLFLAREPGTSREYDYDRVHELVSDFGFEVIFLNRLEITEQIRTVYEAKRIVAPDGSALASLIFTHPEAKTTVLTRVDDSEDWFAFGAEISGSSAQVIRHSGYMGRAWDLDPEVLTAALLR